MLLWAPLAMVATIALFPETETGRFLRRTFIEAPAERLNSLSPRRAFISIATFIVLLSIAPMMIEAAIPIEFALLMAGDMVVYLEAAAMVSLLAAQGRLRAAILLISRIVGRLVRPRASRRHSCAPRKAGREDAEDEGAGFAFA